MAETPIDNRWQPDEDHCLPDIDPEAWGNALIRHQGRVTYEAYPPTWADLAELFPEMEIVPR